MSMQVIKKDVEIFKAGNYGDQGTFSDADIAQMAADYNEQTHDQAHEAPIVIGHPSSDAAPAYGWVKKLKAVGDKLFMSEFTADDKFIATVNDGYFKKRSASIYKNFQNTGKKMLKHVGYLGAVPPVLKGMPDYVFADATESAVVEFSDIETMDLVNRFAWIGRTFAAIRDYLIEKEGMEKADSIVGSWAVTDLNKDLKIEEPEAPEEDNMGYTQQQFDEAVGAAKQSAVVEFSEKEKELTAANTSLAAEVAELKATVASFSEKESLNEVNHFVDGEIAAGRVVPAEKEKLTARLIKLKKIDAEEFSELKADIAARGKSIEFGEFAPNGPAAAKLTPEMVKAGLSEEDLAKFGGIK